MALLFFALFQFNNRLICITSKWRHSRRYAINCIWNLIANFCIGLIWYWAGIKWHLPPYVFIWWIIFSVMQGICGTFFNLISFHSAHRMVAFLNLNITFQSLKLAWNQSVQSAPSMPVLCKPHHYFVKIKFLWNCICIYGWNFLYVSKALKKLNPVVNSSDKICCWFSSVESCYYKLFQFITH